MIKLSPYTKAVAASALCLMLAVALLGCSRLGGSQTSAGDGQLNRAKRLIESGRYEEALMELNNALAKAPNDPQVHMNLGWLYLYTEDLPKAGQELAQVEQLAPDLGETYHLRGALYSYQAQQEANKQEARRKHESAVKNFREALQRNPRNHQAYFDLASSLTALDNPAEALDVLNSGFDHIPGNDLETQVNFQVASCSAHAQLGMLEEAIAECKQALEFTTSPESRQRIEEMINNMQLMNPQARLMDPNAAAVESIPATRSRIAGKLALERAEEAVIIDMAVAD